MAPYYELGLLYHFGTYKAEIMKYVKSIVQFRDHNTWCMWYHEPDWVS
jgi:hypothetical protein